MLCFVQEYGCEVLAIREWLRSSQVIDACQTGANVQERAPRTLKGLMPLQHSNFLTNINSRLKDGTG